MLPAQSANVMCIEIGVRAKYGQRRRTWDHLPDVDRLACDVDIIGHGNVQRVRSALARCHRGVVLFRTGDDLLQVLLVLHGIDAHIGDVGVVERFVLVARHVVVLLLIRHDRIFACWWWAAVGIVGGKPRNEKAKNRNTRRDSE